MKALRGLSFIILTLTLFSIWGAVVRHVYLGGTGLGSATEIVKTFVELPSIVKQVLVNDDLGPYVIADNSFEERNDLDRSIYALGSFFDHSDGSWNVQLTDLKTNAAIQNWAIHKSMLNGESHLGYVGRSSLSNHIQFDHLRAFNPILIDPETVLVMMDGSNNLLLLRNDIVVWQNNDFIFHHAMNLTPKNTVWICGTTPTQNGHNAAFINPGGCAAPYRDDILVEIDLETGKTLRTVSVSASLVKSGYKGLLAARVENDFDPVHLNDVDVAKDSSDFWNMGDLLVSLRNLNTVYIYRPSNDSIVWLQTGNFMTQHDPDFISNHEISVFNNNYLIPTKRAPLHGGQAGQLLKVSEEKSSEYYVYDFAIDSGYSLHDDALQAERILSTTEGQFQKLSNGDIYIESQNAGKIYIYRPEVGIIYSHMFRVEENEAYAHLPNWFRIYENL